MCGEGQAPVGNCNPASANMVGGTAASGGVHNTGICDWTRDVELQHWFCISCLIAEADVVCIRCGVGKAKCVVCRHHWC